MKSVGWKLDEDKVAGNNQVKVDSMPPECDREFEHLGEGEGSQEVQPFLASQEVPPFPPANETPTMIPTTPIAAVERSKARQDESTLECNQRIQRKEREREIGSGRRPDRHYQREME